MQHEPVRLSGRATFAAVRPRRPETLRISAWGSALAAGAAAGYARAAWLRLKHAPAETAETERLGLRVFRAPANDSMLFARTQQHVPDEAAARLPLILVHGMLVSSKVMEPLIGHVGKEFRALAPDLPGYGESRDGRRIADVPQIADALACWLRGLGIERALVFGLSFGCNLVAQLAARHPSLVERLVLQGPGPDPRGRNFPVAVWRDFANAYGEPRSSWGIAKIDYAKAGLRNVVAAIRLALDARIEEILPQVQAPTLVLCGSRDLVCPVPWAEQLTGLLPQGRLNVLKGRAHVLPYGAPDVLADAMLPFLRGET